MTDQRERILSCACDLFLSHGLQGLSMRKLARNVGVTAPALYRHYESKERVLGDVAGEAFKVFARYLYRALEGESAADRFRMTGEGYLNFALDHPRYYEMIYVSPQLLGLEELPREAAAHACSAARFMVDRVREAMDVGMLKAGDPQAVARTIWAHAHGMVSVYIRGIVPMEEEQFRRFFMESAWRLMEGIASPEFIESRRQEAAPGQGSHDGIRRGMDEGADDEAGVGPEHDAPAPSPVRR